jgi:hypothetical protein
MDTHERVANAQVATASGYPRCLITALLSKTKEQGAKQPSSAYPAPPSTYAIMTCSTRAAYP